MLDTQIIFGKDVIDSLTESMYKEAACILREYIQNAADQIDIAVESGILTHRDAGIYITLKDQNISVRDNATGIPAEKVLERLVFVANSNKDGVRQRGCRGIGRLAGLAYCHELQFVTSYKGESKQTILKWDADKMRDLLASPDKSIEAAEVIKNIVSIETCPCSEDEHFFEVKLLGIFRQEEKLLNYDYIKNYLSLVAPLPFDTKFIFKSKILDFVKQHNLRLDEYKVYLNGEQLFKSYNSRIYGNASGAQKVIDEIHDIDVRLHHSATGDLLGWSWVAITNFVKQLQVCNAARGLRIRKGNIQVGDEDTLCELFTEKRANHYFLGEVHACHSLLKPNSQRDHFNQNETFSEFRDILSKYCESLTVWFNGASKAQNAYRAQENVQKLKRIFKEKEAKRDFSSSEEREKMVQKIDAAEKEASDRNKTLRTYERKATIIPHLDTILGNIKKNYSIQDTEIITDDIKQTTSPTGYRSQKLSKLSKKDQKIIGRVFSVIDNVLLDEGLAEELKQKIEDEFK